MRDLGAQVGF